MKNPFAPLQPNTKRDLSAIRSILSLLFVITLSTLSYAATITVTNTTDSDPGSLRDAVALASATDSIIFDVSLNGDTIKLTSGQISISKSIKIIGNGISNTIIDGTASSRIFENTATGVSIIGLTIQNGETTLPGALGDGSGVNNLGAGELTIRDCAIVNNLSRSNGGGVNSAGPKITIINSTLSGNTSTASGGGLNVSSGEANLINVIVSGNEADGTYGGGIGILSGDMTITNSVISGNKGKFGGGIGMTGNATLNLRHSTISGNTASNKGSGIYHEISVLSVYHTIVAKNIDPSGNDGSDIERFSNSNNPSTINDLGFNHVMDPNGDHNITSGNNVDPLFITDVPMIPSTGGDLRLLCASVAIDAGISDTTGLNLDTIDISGQPRLAGKRIDIGAYERMADCHEIDIIDSGVSIADSSIIDYGEICLPETKTYFIKNTGKQFLIIDTIIVGTIGTNPTQFVYNTVDFTFPDTIACGYSLMMDITFLPLSVGFDSASIKIFSNDMDEGIYDLIVVGASGTSTPQVTCIDTTVYLDAQGQVSIDSSFIIDALLNVCGSVTADIDIDSFDCDDIGINTATLTITESSSGTQFTCSADVTILDTISPDVTCMDATIVLGGAGTFIIDSSYVISSISDNCDIASATVSQTSFNCTDIGANMVTLTVTDINGNVTTCTAQVIVNASLTYVTNSDDSGCGSFRSAVANAMSGDTITFGVHLDGDTIKLTSGQIDIVNNLVVMGNDSSLTIIDGTANDRIFRVFDNDTVALHNLTIQNGGAVTRGGGIDNFGVLTMSHCQIKDNNSTSSGGGINSAGPTAQLFIYNSRIVNNQSKSDAGGIKTGGIKNVISKSLIAGNTVSNNNGVAIGGGIWHFGNNTLNISNSIISGNYVFSEDSRSQGGGIYVGGGQTSPILILTNSTISGNTVQSNSTSGPGIGGGLFITNLGTSVTVTNSIIAKNSSEVTGRDDIYRQQGTLTDGGNNHVMAAGTHGITSGNNIDPLFVMDVDTSVTGPTTSGDLRLADGSPAIDAGTPDTTGLNIDTLDIAGLSRVQGGIDIGAHERALSFAQYTDCSQTNIDIDSVLLSTSDPLALYRAQDTITSDVTLTRDITSKAEQMVLLDEEFTVPQGFVLEVIMEECVE